MNHISTLLSYHLTPFPAEVLRGPLDDQFRRNFGDSFSVFFCRRDEPDRLNGSGMKMFFPRDAPPPANEVSEDEREEEGPALTSSVLELSVRGLMEATDPERWVFSSGMFTP